jgi:hypothetical protein
MKLNALEARTVSVVEGVTVTLAALSRSDLMAAVRASIGENPDDLFAEALAVRLIKSWAGITDEADEPLECTPDNIVAFVRDPQSWLFVAEHIVAPASAVINAKNASAA